MNETLFLYIDILGFSELIKNKADVDLLFQIVDQARIHSDSKYKAIVFSDTIIAYNKNTNYSREAKEIEVMFLIELTQDIFSRLIGRDIYFRAIITEGEFSHNKLNNLEAYYGTALVNAYNAEKSLSGTGLFLDKKLRELNRVFRFKEFSKQFDYIFLTHVCSGITSWLSRNVDENEEPDFKNYPLPADLLVDQGLEYLVYPELVHFSEIYKNMNNHPEPKVREKHLTTWNMYTQAYPGLTRSLVKYNFDPNGMAELDWSKAREMYEEDSQYALE